MRSALLPAFLMVLFTTVFYLIEESVSFCVPHVSFQGKRESRNPLLAELDARLRGHDRKISPTAHLITASVIILTNPACN